MTELEGTKKTTEGVNYYVFISFCILIALVLIAAYSVGLMPARKGELVDCDCYMHLIRASDLYNHGQWYDPVWIKSNAPLGEPLHWSRPFDVLLLAGAIPLSLFVDFETALFAWGVALSPVLMVIALIALNWTTRVVLNKDGTFLVILFFLAQAVVRSVFQPARPDHHGLLLLFYILQLGLVLRIIVKPFKRSRCYGAAAVSAMAIWISVESMVPVCVTIGILGFLWVLKEEDFLRKSFHYALGLFLFCCLFLVAERPFHNLTLIKYDSISIVYAGILGLMALFGGAASVLSNSTSLLQRRTLRLVCGLLGAACIALIIYRLFPKLYQGPFADVDPRIIAVWFNKTKEIQPLLSSSISLGVSVQLIGLAMVSFPFMFYLLVRRKETVSQNAWIYITLSAILFFLMALYQMRWTIYPYTLFSIVMAELLSRLLSYKNEKMPIVWRAIKNSMIALMMTMGFLYTGVLAEKILSKPPAGPKYNNPPLSKICDYLNSRNEEAKHSLQIMTHPFFAAEILYRTDHSVVATANTYGQGILDTYDVMTAQTDDHAFKILRSRQIEMILLCPKSPESAMYSKPSQTSTFYRRLCEGQVPLWLNKVELPENLNEDFLIFETIF
jgi:hypothetical protein